MFFLVRLSAPDNSLHQTTGNPPAFKPAAPSITSHSAKSWLDRSQE
jgi:hypothetical protein